MSSRAYRMEFGKVQLIEHSGDKGSYFTIKKNYKDKNGAWQKTDFLYYSDLAELAQLIGVVSSQKFKVQEFKPKTEPAPDTGSGAGALGFDGDSPPF